MAECYFDYNRDYNTYLFNYIYNNNIMNEGFFNMFKEWMVTSLQNCTVIGCCI